MITTLFISCVLSCFLLHCSFANAQSWAMWTHNANNTLDNVFGLNSDLNDNSSIRINSRFTYVGLGLFETDESFTKESFHDKVIAALPDSMKSSENIFREKLMILEYCSWQFTTAQFRPCGQLSMTNWKTFLETVMNKPACMNRDESNGFQIVPFNKSIKSTLVRFTFDGADQSRYFDDIFTENAVKNNPMKLCPFPSSNPHVPCDASICFAGDTKEANTIDSAITVRSVKLPTGIDAEWNRIKRLIQQNPADSGAVAAIIILIIIFLLAFCLYKCLTKKQPKSVVDETTGGGVEGGNGEDVVVPEARRNAEVMNVRSHGESTRGGSSDDHQLHHQTTTTTTRTAANINIINNNNDGDDDDAMARAIAAARSKMKQQQQQQQNTNNNNTNSSYGDVDGDHSNFQQEMTETKNRTSGTIDNASLSRVEHHHDNVNNNNDDNNDDHNSSVPSSMKKMGLGSELFGLPRDGDQPAILSAPSVHEGHDTSACDRDGGDTVDDTNNNSKNQKSSDTNNTKKSVSADDIFGS